VCGKKLFCTMDPFSVESFVEKPNLKVWSGLEEVAIDNISSAFQVRTYNYDEEE